MYAIRSYYVYKTPFLYICVGKTYGCGLFSLYAAIMPENISPFDGGVQVIAFAPAYARTDGAPGGSAGVRGRRGSPAFGDWP